MALVSTPLESVLVARYQIDVTSGGSPILRQKSFAGIKSAAADQDIYDVAVALFDLLQYPLVDVRRDNRFDLIDE